MGAAGVFGIAAIVFGGAMAACFGFEGAKICQRRMAAATALAADRQERQALLLLKGCGPLRPLARKALGFPAVREAAEIGVLMFEERSMSTTSEALASLWLLAAMVSGAIGGVITFSPVCAVAVACLVAVVALVYARNVADKRAVAMREQIPNALRCMGTCFRSGLSLPQTLQQTARECGGALGPLFGIAARRLKMGATPAEALSIMRSDEEVPELSFVAVALDVQHQSGGSIAPVLETARESVISELDLTRSLRVQTAQAKLSASIVTVMPFLLVALFSLVSPDFLQPFFTSAAGLALLALALVMQLAGVLAVRRMLHVDAG